MALNPYCNYYSPLTKEGAVLFNAAIPDFKSLLENKDRLKLTPKDATKFVETMSALALKFGYHYMLSNVLTDQQPDNAGVMQLTDEKDLLQSWNSITDDHVRKLASMTWGDKSYSFQNPQTLETMSLARGEINPPGQ